MGVVPVLVVAAACQARPTACSLVGLVPGDLKVDVTQVERAYPSADLVVRVCIGGRRCHTVRPGLRRISIGIFRDATPIRVRVLVVTSTGRTVFDGATRLEPVKLQPNGPGCPPVAWVAAVKAEHRHSLQGVRLSPDTGGRPLSR